MIDATITLTTDMEEIMRCQQAVGLLMSGDATLDETDRDKVAILINFLNTAQQRYFDALQTQAAA